MRTQKSLVMIAVQVACLLSLCMTMTGCNGVLKSLFDAPQSAYEPETATQQHTATASGEPVQSGSGQSTQQAAPATANTADKQTQAVEQAGGFFSSLATLLPPPWNVAIPALITGGVGWYASKRRHKRPASST